VWTSPSRRNILDWLRNRLAARAKRSGNQPFMIGGTKRLDTVIDTWRQRPRNRRTQSA
jgi:hypothetical protein